MARVAFLGLGVMGFPMAGHLAAAGHQVTVWNRTAAKAEAWAGKHAGRAAATARAVLAGLEEGLAGMRVHGRRLELRVEDGAAGGTAEALRRLLGQPVFMLVGGLWQEDAGAEAILAQARVAHIGSLVARAGNDRTRSWTADLLAPRAMQQAMLAAAQAASQTSSSVRRRP